MAAKRFRGKKESITDEGSLAGQTLRHGVEVEMLGAEERLRKIARDCQKRSERSERRIKNAPPSDPPAAAGGGK